MHDSQHTTAISSSVQSRLHGMVLICGRKEEDVNHHVGMMGLRNGCAKYNVCEFWPKVQSDTNTMYM